VIVTALAAAAAAALAATAVPDERGAGTRYDRESYPYAELVNQPLTLPRALVRLDVPVHVNVSKDAVGKPWYIPPALDVGVTDDLQLGLFHEVGFCPAGAQNGCNKLYDDVGVRAGLSLARTRAAQLVLEGNVLAYDLAVPEFRAGLALAYRHSLGMAGVEIRAGLDAFVTDRDTLPYRELLFGEGAGTLQLGEGFAVVTRIRAEKALEEASGVSVPLRVPVSLGVELEPWHPLALGAALQFTNLLGEEATADARELVVFVRLFL
jgi:hypothetical protein